MVFYVTLLISSLGAILAIVTAIVGWGVLPGVIDDIVRKNVVIMEGNEIFENWKQPPFPINFTVYIFEILNPEGLDQGEKPIVKERGPYIYKEYRQKYNISQTPNVLGYLEKQIFVFDEVASYPNTQDDKINVMNLAMNTIMQMAEDNSLLAITINQVLSKIFNSSSVIQEITPRSLLFEGIPFCADGPDIICDQIRKQESDNISVKNGTAYFSLLGYKNNSNSGHFTIKTGYEDVSEVNKVLTWNYKSRLSIWPERYGNDTRCNEIDGTENSLYPPFLDKNKDITIFVSDLCRAVTTAFEEEVTVKDMKAFRYTGNEDAVPAPSIEDGTICLCSQQIKGITQENGCLKKGVVDMLPCTGSPVVLSFPHMYLADEDYSNSVIGLQPDPLKHTIVLDIEPLTGIPLNAKNRVQFNMFLRKIKNFPITKNFSTALVPAIWLEEGFTIPDDQADELKDTLFYALNLIKILKWVLLSVGIAVFVVFIVLFAWVKKKESNYSI